MNVFEALNSFVPLDSELCVRWTQTLLHSVWQGIAAALVVFSVSRLGRASAQTRYSVNVVAILLLAIALPVTFVSVPARVADAPDGAAARGANASVTPEAATPTEAATRDVTASADEPALAPLPVPAAPRHRSLELADIAPLATVLYALGVFFMLARLARAVWSSRGLRHRATPITDGEALAILRRQARRAGLRATPAFATCRRITVPVVVGVVRPSILLPLSLASGLAPAHLEAILAHELAHVRRHDVLVHLFLRLIEALLFFHPAVWYVSRRIRIERERVCDDLAIASGCERSNYVDALLGIAERTRPAWPSEAIALAASGARPSEFKRRILRLLGEREVDERFTRAALCVHLALVASLLAVPVVARGLESERPPTDVVRTDDRDEPLASRPKEDPEAPRPVEEHPETPTPSTAPASSGVVVWRIDCTSPARTSADARKFGDKRFRSILQVAKSFDIPPTDILISDPTMTSRRDRNDDERILGHEQRQTLWILQQDTTQFDVLFAKIAQFASEHVRLQVEFVMKEAWTLSPVSDPDAVYWSTTLRGSADKLFRAKEWYEKSERSLREILDSFAIGKTELAIGPPRVKTHLSKTEPTRPSGYSFTRDLEFVLRDSSRFEALFEALSKKLGDDTRLEYRVGARVETHSSRRFIARLRELQRDQSPTLTSPATVKRIEAYEWAFRLQTLIGGSVGRMRTLESVERAESRSDDSADSDSKLRF